MELKDCLEVIKKRWLMILLTILLPTVIAVIISFFIITPVYQSNTTLYVGKNLNAQDEIDYGDLRLAEQLVKDYQQLIKSRLIADTVIKTLELQNITAEELAMKLSVNLKSETRLIEITAEDQDPYMAQKIADKVAEVFQDKVRQIMKQDNLQIIDRAQVAEYPVKPKKTLIVVITALISAISALGFVYVAEQFDITLNTADDIRKELGLTVIGTVPEFHSRKD